MNRNQYLFFIREVLPQASAHSIQVVQCANAAAGLGYNTWLTYLDRSWTAANPSRWLNPIQPRPASPQFREFYNIQSDLRLIPLALPWPIDRVRHRLTNASTAVCKYYWPLFLRHQTGLVHTRDWNFVKAALQAGAPVIYECHHFLSHPYDPEVVNHPLLQVAVTVVDTVKANMIDNGMPPEKIMVLANGFNPQFLDRHPAAAVWRHRLLGEDFQRLVVYAGALYPFKGIDLLLEAARALPRIKFAIAGGPVDQQHHYQAAVQRQGLSNVALLGFLPQKELAELLQAADVLAHPHLSGQAASFTSPLKLFDYLASGTPIVASRIPSLAGPDYAESISAWCQPDQVQSLVEGIQTLLSCHPRPDAGFQSPEQILQKYSWKARIQSILNRVEPPYRPEPMGNSGGIG
ncbi:glycosyl transferase family 1 [filamentous cyanobacterium CCP5]|nr:glycosyl transferase family 1 [filamentous cyanobacterium CCP5]